jgi:hypothetical protein
VRTVFPKGEQLVPNTVIYEYLQGMGAKNNVPRQLLTTGHIICYGKGKI